MQGLVLDLTLSKPLAGRVVAQNSKAALFGTLCAFSKLAGCAAVYWGFESSSWKRVVIVVGELELPSGPDISFS